MTEFFCFPSCVRLFSVFDLLVLMLLQSTIPYCEWIFHDIPCLSHATFTLKLCEGVVLCISCDVQQVIRRLLCLRCQVRTFFDNAVRRGLDDVSITGQRWRATGTPHLPTQITLLNKLHRLHLTVVKGLWKTWNKPELTTALKRLLRDHIRYLITRMFQNMQES